MHLRATLAMVSLVLTAAAVRADDAQQLFSFADRLRAEGLHKTAIPQFEKFLKTYPAHELTAEALFRLADCHYQLKQFPQAILYYTELAAKYKDKPFYHRSLQRLGHCKLLTGDLDGCIAALNEALKQPNLDPKLARGARFLLGKAWYQKKDYARSLELLSKVAADGSAENTYRAMACVIAGDAALRINKPQEAVKAFQAHLQLGPGEPERAETMLRLADAFRSMKNYAEALKYYGQIPAESPLAPAALEGAARSLLMLGKYDEALAKAAQLAKNYPDSPLVDSSLQVAGFCYYEKKDYPRAAAVLAKLLHDFPKSTFAETTAHKLCWSYYRQGEQKRAELLEACNAFAASFPQSSLLGDILFLRGEARFWSKEYGLAIENYVKVPERTPCYRAARFMIAVAHQEAGNPQNALATLEAFAREFPDAPEAEDALFRSANLSLQSKQYARAEQKCREYLARYPNGRYAADITYQRAESLRMQGKYEEMAAAFDRYLKISKDNERKGRAQFWIARAEQSTGDSLAAQAAKQAGAAQATTYRQAIAALERALAAFDRCGKLSEAARTDSLVRIAECRYSLGTARAALAQTLHASARQTEREKGKNAAAAAYKEALDTQNKAKRDLLEAANLYLKHAELVGNKRALVWAGAYFRTIGDRANAIATFQKLLQVAPDSSFADRAMEQIGDLYAEGDTPDWAESARWHAKLLDYYAQRQKADPKAPTPFLNHARYGLARALYNQGKPDDAASLLEKVIAAVPDGEKLSAAALVQLAHIRYTRNELDAAGDIFRRIGLLFDDPEITPEALYWAGRVTAEAGEVMEGAKLWALLGREYSDSNWWPLAREQLQRRGIILDDRGYVKE